MASKKELKHETHATELIFHDIKKYIPDNIQVNWDGLYKNIEYHIKEELYLFEQSIKKNGS